MLKKIALLGWGSSCKSVYNFFANKIDIYIWDDNENVRKKLLLEDKKVINPEKWGELNLDFIICSPGISLNYPKVHNAKVIAEKYNINIISDIELYYFLNPNIKYIGITGSNGKSTVASLIYHVLKSAKYKVRLGGNIGIAIFDINPKGVDWIILELSSYQLQLCKRLKLEYGLHINISPDHLDYHGSYDNYKKAKSNIFDLSSLSILNSKLISEYENVYDFTRDNFFIVSNNSNYDVQYTKTNIIDYHFIKNSKIHISNISLKGLHNQQNIAFVYVLSILLGIKVDEFINYCNKYVGLAHRQEFVAEYKNITFINDSKATNMDATENALINFKNVYLIAGGKFKTKNYFNINKELIKNIKKIFIIGKNKETLVNFCLDNKICYLESNSLDIAVKIAFEEALENKNKAIILLSPGAASFDQFNNFEHRGNVFKDKVKSLINECL